MSISDDEVIEQAEWDIDNYPQFYKDEEFRYLVELIRKRREGSTNDQN